jgi:hypothetical protein
MTKSKLGAVDPETTETRKPKILIYGKPGTGKTWGCLGFPNVYYIDTEGGADLPRYVSKLKTSNGVYFGIKQGSLDFSTVLEQIEALATEKHSHKTVVIDSVTKIIANEIAKEAERLAKKGLKNEFSADKKPAIGLMRRLVSWLQRIDMNVILIAHEKAEWLNGEQKGETFDAWDKLEYELNLCLQIIKTGDKRLAKVRKSRLTDEFPDGETFPWSYEELAARYGKSFMEKESRPLVLAAPEQIIELTSLLDAIKLPEGQQAKWLTQLNAASFEEADSEKIGALIKRVKEKFIPKGE